MKEKDTENEIRQVINKLKIIDLQNINFKNYVEYKDVDIVELL